MKHTFTSAKTSGVDATLLRPSDWNAMHVHGMTSLSASTSITSAHDFIVATGGSLGITLTLPSAVGITGRPYVFLRDDDGTGYSPPSVVTIAASGGQTIGRFSTYSLVNQDQFVELVSDGSNWRIKGAN